MTTQPHYLDYWGIKVPSITPSFLGHFAASVGMSGTAGTDKFHVGQIVKYRKDLQYHVISNF